MYYSMSWEIKAQTELLVRIVAFLPFCKRQISEGNHIWEGSPLPLLIDRIKRFCRLKESPGIVIDAELCISLESFVGLKSSCLLENGIHIALRGPAFWSLWSFPCGGEQTVPSVVIAVGCITFLKMVIGIASQTCFCLPRCREVKL